MFFVFCIQINGIVCKKAVEPSPADNLQQMAPQPFMFYFIPKPARLASNGHWPLTVSFLLLPQPVEVAVSVSGFHFVPIHQGEYSLGRISRFQFLSLVPLFGVQGDPFDIVFRLHGMEHGAHGHRHDITSHFDDGHLYEPSHGSAPDIAGQNKANPIATILSAAMMLRYSLDLDKEADAVEAAVQKVLTDGYRTGDIMSKGCTLVGTKEMGDLIAKEIR